MLKFSKNWVLETASSVQDGACVHAYVLHAAQQPKHVLSVIITLILSVIITLILHIIIRNALNKQLYLQIKSVYDRLF